MVEENEHCIYRLKNALPEDDASRIIVEFRAQNRRIKDINADLEEENEQLKKQNHSVCVTPHCHMRNGSKLKQAVRSRLKSEGYEGVE